MAAGAGAKELAAALQRRFRRDLSDFAASPAPVRAITLSARAPSGFVVEPKDLHTRDAGRGAAMLAGRIALAGETLQVAPDEPLWSRALPSRRFAAALHGFDWLGDLMAVGEEGREAARDLFDRWLDQFGAWNWFAWSPEVAARRLEALTLAGPALFGDEAASRSRRRFATLARAARRVERGLDLIEDDRGRLDAAMALMLGHIAFDLGGKGFTRAGGALAEALKRQLLPDGGHVSRCPETAAKTFVRLAIIEEAAIRRGVAPDPEIRRALDRLAPLIGFFQLKDGALAAFHGGGEGDRKAVKAAARLHDAPKKSFDYAPHSAFHRMEAGGSIAIIDSGGPPKGAHAREAHASALAFEFSAAGGRIVVNCGWREDQPEDWREAVRATAAHSALTLEETSSARLLKPGWRRDLLGPRLAIGPEPVTVRRNEEEMGVWLEATHDGYRRRFGLGARRRLFLASDGGDLRGEDGLYRPVEDGPPPDPERRLQFAIRFHLHPDVRASLSRDSMSALLVLPNGDGWRFRTDGGPVRLERSVYLAGGVQPERSTQLVVAGEAEPYGAGDRPPNRVRWAFQRLGRVGAAG